MTGPGGSRYLSSKAGFSLIFILALFTSGFWGCENNIETVKLVTDNQQLPVETSSKLEILYSDSAKAKVRVTAPRLNRFDNPELVIELPEGVKVEFFDSENNVSSTLTARFALRRENEGIMEARNDVVVINSKSEKLNTEHLIWNEKTAKIYSDEFVKITTKDKIIMGDGFESDPEFINYKIFKIKGTISLHQDEHTKNP